MASNLNLPRLYPSSEDADVCFVWRLGESAPSRPDSAATYTLKAPDGRSGTLLLGNTEYGTYYEIPGLGTYILNSEQGEIEFFPHGAASARWVEYHLVHMVLALYAGMKGEVCLHASSVAKGEEALVFGGPSGVGKSTTAWRLLKRGWELVSDDAVVVKRAGDRWFVAPGARTIRIADQKFGDVWESDDKYEGFVRSCPDAKAVRKVVLLDHRPREDAPAMAEKFKSLLRLQVGWSFGSASTRKRLENRTWQMLSEVECTYENRERLVLSAT